MAGVRFTPDPAWVAEIEAGPEVQEIVDRVGRDAARRASVIAPYDTGRLAFGIDYQNGVLSADAPYASFVEYGTRKMKAQPYMRPALDAAIRNAT